MSKIQNLLQAFPQNVVLTTQLLAAQGYSPQLMQKYLDSGWVERVGIGAYKRKHEKVSWVGALWALMQEMADTRISGRTALEIQGYEHFLSLGRRVVYVSHDRTTLIPKWIKNYDFGVDFVFIRSDHVEASEINNITLEGLDIRSSSLERAAFEVCLGIPKYYTYDSALYFFESLTSLRAYIVQQVLEESKNIKAKRLFLHFADHSKHQWFSELNLSKIDLGSGKRQIFADGVFDPHYLITVPKSTNFGQ